MSRLLLILSLAAASICTVTAASPAQAQGSTSGVVPSSMLKAPLLQTPTLEYSRANCARIVSEFRRQGASPYVAYRLGHTIAWRESGCSMQCVEDGDDRACSRLGINFKWRGAYTYWKNLCGAASPDATRVLRVDVKCALAAYRQAGWRPWR